MIRIVNILGGLGNQMFQLAFATALAFEFPNDIIKLNRLCFRGYVLHNGLEIDKIFTLVHFPYSSLSELCKYAWPWNHYRLWQVGTRVLPLRKSMTKDTIYKKEFDYSLIKDKSYFDGYWQSPKFFEKYSERIRKVLEFPPFDESDTKNANVINFIKNDKTAFIHVRRGDYVRHPKFGGICTLEYYKKALNELRNKTNYKQYVIFSNDTEWCQDNLSPLLSDNQILYVNWNKNGNSFRDMQLMSLCSAGIIANSSFSWWGAWLGNLETVICPTKWTNTPNDHEDIIPTGWIKI